MEALQWVIGILVVIMMGVMGFFATQLWGHVVECRQLMARLEGMDSDVRRMKEDIGTHSTGMRGHLHETANLCTKLELRVTLLERN